MPGTLPLPTGSLLRKSGRSLLATLAIIWLALWSLLGLVETAPLLHHPRVPLWHALLIVFTSTGVLAAWLFWALRTKRFERFATDPPRCWFLHHLRVVPLLIVGEWLLVGGLREAAWVLMGTRYKYLPLQ